MNIFSPYHMNAAEQWPYWHGGFIAILLYSILSLHLEDKKTLVKKRTV